MKVTKDTITLSKNEIEELLRGKEIKTQQGSIIMEKLNYLDLVTFEIFHLGITREKLIMLKETNKVEHKYHKLIIE